MAKVKAKSLYSRKIQNIKNSWILLSSMGIFILLVGYIFSVLLDSVDIVIISGIFAISSSFLTYWFSDKYILSATNTKIIDRASNKELYDVVDNIAIAAGIQTPKIGIIEDSAPNAFATGRDVKHSFVVFTTGLLDKLDKKEVKGVVAHEISHIINGDMLLGTIAVIFALIVEFMSKTFIRSGARSSNSKNKGGILIFVGLIVAIISPIIVALIKKAISREREFLADATGAYLVGNPENLASALEKISNYRLPMITIKKPDHLAHLFISDPRGTRIKMVNKNSEVGGFLSKIEDLFSTHPPIEERIARLRGMDKYGDI